MNVDKICSELVKIKSENPPGDTADAAEYIRNFLESTGIAAELTENEGGHNNVISKYQMGKLLLTGHIDVVPALNEGWDIPPYEGRIDDTFVHGRGATDMKGGCASILSAVENLADKGGIDEVNLAFVCDEEGGGRYGTRWLIEKKLIHPCDCLIAEPTLPHAPCIGQKGLCRYTVEFNGNPGHSSIYPIIGTSAVMQAVDFLQFMDVLHNREITYSPEMEKLLAESIKLAGNGYEKDVSPAFRRIMYNPGIISGGERANIVAQKCKLTMDMRLPWGVDVNKLLEEIRGSLPEKAVLFVDSTANASLTAQNTFLVKTACAAISAVYNVESRPMVQWAASDARALRLAGFNAIEYGPGELEGMHGLNEKVRRDQLEKCVAIYENIIRAYQEKQ
ncbi:MAG TPA: M20/M25/M40 family metallo-hydrolase [Methanocorpusculum sp.]|nr:M20/M25/M40 family metallo-hydrolase [Methanocorpusculum sp.]